MDRVELMSALEDRYQIDLNEANFAKVSTVGDLERLLHEPQKSRAARISVSALDAAMADHLDTQCMYYLLTWPATMIMAHPTIVGRENLRGVDGPLLVTATTSPTSIGIRADWAPPRLRP